ncbi:MAG: helix-turn-helix domain-containing protein [Planctomycetota bacterium]|nr:helix-turn-helix domain-containing protein [Planctomycetota bacterium]
MDFLSSEQVQGALHISRPTLYLWVRQGKLKAQRAGRALLFREEDVRALVRPAGAAKEQPRMSREEALALLRNRQGTGTVLLPYTREELYERHPPGQ